ncbi:MAG: tetratricopeptide repeat protein [Pseudomonadota bacterium]
MDDLTEDQQLERLKSWWAENGKAIIAGIALGGAGLFGWNQWQASKDSAAMAASAQFDKAAEASAAADLTLLKQAVTALQDEHAGSPYVTQGQLQLAALHVQRGEMEEAESLLDAVFQASRGQPEQAIIGLRLARVQLYRENGDAALATLDAISGSRYASAVSELRGDILRKAGRDAEARAAYSDALSDPGSPPVIDAGMVEMKRASLATPESDEAS